MFFRKREEIERYEADWPAEDEEPYVENLGETEEVHVRSRKSRILLMLFSGYVILIGLGTYVSWEYTSGNLFQSPVQVSVRGWEQKSSFDTLVSEYQRIEAIWNEIERLNQETVSAVKENKSLVPLQIKYADLADEISSHIRYTSTIRVYPDFAVYVTQLVELEKNMEEFGRLMNTALVHQDASALTKAETVRGNVLQGLERTKNNLDGIARLLKLKGGGDGVVF